MRSIMQLPFEKPIYEIEEKIEELKTLNENSETDLSSQIETLTNQLTEFKKNLYDNLKPYERIQIARHPMRPTFLDYIHSITTDWIELHGDRAGTDDRAIIGGIARLNDKPVMFIGTQKGKTTRENLEYNFGMPNPQGYRKALRLFKHAEKFGFPIVTIVDTPGAYPGIKAEETGQGVAIAENLLEMAKLKVPVIAIITGEGCSGGALGLAVANKVYMLENAYYTVITPEGCASILWNDANYADKAAEALKITADFLLESKIIDGIIKEPLGGAHYDPEETYKNMKEMILKGLDELSKLSEKDLIEKRYSKYRAMGEISFEKQD
ncbi:MAG: acetyl-CoA carboxylase carboxyltransferase subunit alpha [Candidatus Gastranaerophilales bacterium]|nr:acetyl-CoA carboxylase carboxyltransferase subunit alpha [Candidatus Gastranaerophilales bacterium]